VGHWAENATRLASAQRTVNAMVASLGSPSVLRRWAGMRTEFVCMSMLKGMMGHMVELMAQYPSAQR
jgi:hypothetical protein